MNWHPFTKYGPAIGMALWKWNRKKIELWWSPADYSPQEHAHDGCSGEFTILWAKNRRIYRKTKWETKSICVDGVLGIEHKLAVGPKDEYIANTPQVWGKWLTVPAGVPHKFDAGESMMIWLVVETWKPGYNMSLATDFRVTE